MNATYITKRSTGRVHLTVPGTHHGSFFSDGYGAAGHVYTPADGYTLCGNLTKYGGYVAGEETTDGAKTTCKVCAKRYAALNDSKGGRFAVAVDGAFLSDLGRGTYEVTSDVDEAIQFDNTAVAEAYVKYFDGLPSFTVVAA